MNTAPPEEEASQERTLYEVNLNIQYSVRLHSLHCRLFERLRKITSFLTVISGTAVVGALKNESIVLGSFLGLAVTILGTANLVWDFGGIARAHEAQRRRYNNLMSEAEMTVADADRKRASIAADDPAEIEALRVVALNDVCRTFGHQDGLEEESFRSQFMRAIA